jgi:fatty acid synthase
MFLRKISKSLGGLGGVGMEVSEWLVQRGARKLVLICRRGVTSGYKSMQIRRWRDAGVTVMTTTQGITNEEGAVTLLQKATRLGPVGGVFILTMVSGQCKMVCKMSFVSQLYLIHYVLDEKV